MPGSGETPSARYPLAGMDGAYIAPLVADIATRIGDLYTAQTDA